MSVTTTALSRRNMIKGAAFGLAALALPPALTACSSASTGASATSGSLVPLPTYVPITGGPAADLAGSDVVQPAYYGAPDVDSLFTSVAAKPGTGGSVSGFVITYSSPPPADNPYMSYMEEQIGVSFDLQYVPSDSYDSKFATVMAGGDIPDYVQFLAFQLPSRYPQLLEAQFTDLSDHLSGDNVTAYPNLANIPTASWVECRINGRIWGVPQNRPAFGSIFVCRPDLIEEITGSEPNPQSKDEFTELCAAITDAKANRYALSGQSNGTEVDWGYDFMGAMFGVPNGWAEDGGRLTHKYETDAWLEMLDYIKELNDAGYYHPDTPSLEGAQVKTYISNGTVLMHLDGISALLDTTLPEGTVTGAIVPFAADGGPGVIYQGSSMFGFTAIRKTDDADRVDELLKILDYLAAPFGSAEQFTINHGEEGVHYTMEDGEAVLTDAGTAQVSPSSLYRLASGPQVLYSAIPIDEQLRRSHAFQEAAADMLLTSPVAGLYSESASTTASATSTANGVFTDYILGRATRDDVKSAISTWTAQAGDAMRSEYEEALAALG